MPITIHDATDDDVPAIAAILNQAILHTKAIWYDTPKAPLEMVDWFAAKKQGDWPVLVAKKENHVAGYTTYGSFRPHDGYRGTVEHSVYVDPKHHRQGIGRDLLAAIIDRARQQGRHVMVGGIEANNRASLALHAELGFVEVARMPEVGRKFDEWLTLVFMQKMLPSEQE